MFNHTSEVDEKVSPSMAITGNLAEMIKVSGGQILMALTDERQAELGRQKVFQQMLEANMAQTQAYASTLITLREQSKDALEAMRAQSETLAFELRSHNAQILRDIHEAHASHLSVWRRIAVVLGIVGLILILSLMYILSVLGDVNSHLAQANTQNASLHSQNVGLSSRNVDLTSKNADLSCGTPLSPQVLVPSGTYLMVWGGQNLCLRYSQGGNPRVLTNPGAEGYLWLIPLSQDTLLLGFTGVKWQVFPSFDRAQADFCQMGLGNKFSPNYVSSDRVQLTC